MSTTVLSPLAPAQDGEDWPTYMHDARRSGFTREVLPRDLQLGWLRTSAIPPKPAWPGPAKWDGYNKVYDLEDRMIFDIAFQVAAVGDAVYYGSSVDDQLYCVDANSGETRWRFFTEGPIRLAPTVVDGRVYIGSDDGAAYCLNAQDGSLLWKRRPAPIDRRVPGNGRMVSVWPVRTSVVVIDGVAYLGAGVFPWEKVYLCALDALSGDLLWRNSMEDRTAQGYLLATDTSLYVAAGRERPLVFDRDDGKRLFQLGGGGGTYALVGGGTIVHGPGKTGQMTMTDADSRDQLATFEGNHMIVAGHMSYLHTDDQLSALDRERYLELSRERRRVAGERKKVEQQLRAAEKDKRNTEVEQFRKEIAAKQSTEASLSKEMTHCMLWTIPCDQPFALILAGDTLYAGGRDEVVGYHVSDGAKVWSGEVDGRAYGLAASRGKLYVSTDKGGVAGFAGTEQVDD